MAKGNKREITWCFMPSISGRGESEKSTISKKKILKINKEKNCDADKCRRMAG